MFRNPIRPSTNTSTAAAAKVRTTATTTAVPPAATAVTVVVRVAVVVAATVLLLVGVAASASAAPVPPPEVNDLHTVIDNLRYWVMGIIGAVATLFLTIGATRYMTAGGEPSEVERAKGAFKSAGIGYGLALLAPAFLTILNEILQA